MTWSAGWAEAFFGPRLAALALEARLCLSSSSRSLRMRAAKSWSRLTASRADCAWAAVLVSPALTGCPPGQGLSE